LTAVAKLLRSSTCPLQGITAILIVLGAGAGPWLVRHGDGGLAAYASRVPAWWPAIPAGVLIVLAVVKAKCALFDAVEGMYGALKARLADVAQRRADAAELGTLRLRMRRRYRAWLKQRNHSVQMLGFAAARAHALQDEIGTMLEERYGIDVRARFITADDDDATSPSGEPSAYAGRIKRLRTIIIDIRLGRIKRRAR
jgi:hypothetical protein